METVLTFPKMHPYIMNDPTICGGRSIIAGTRMPVWSLIKWYKLGLSIEEILREFPHLLPAQVHDAFSYYYDHQAEIERDIWENENEAYLRTLTADLIVS